MVLDGGKVRVGYGLAYTFNELSRWISGVVRIFDTDRGLVVSVQTNGKILLAFDPKDVEVITLEDAKNLKEITPKGGHGNE